MRLERHSPPKAVRDRLVTLVRGNGTGVGIALTSDERARQLRLNEITSATTGVEDYGIDHLRADLATARIRAALDFDGKQSC